MCIRDSNSRFTEFNEMMAALMSAQDMDQAYRSKDSIKFTMDLDTMSGRPCEVTLEGESLMKGLNASGTYTLGLDLGGLKDGLEAMGQDVYKRHSLSSSLIIERSIWEVFVTEIISL